ncbi:MAG TPA: GIY-YIG nuclease family protein [Woeseiaceae bacterium]|nr:GIY-YIG nuclease family protein [Woeseiaceae bacterium]
MLACADGSLYTGIARDVTQRLLQHEHGSRGAKYLRGRGPLRVVFSATIGSRSKAQQVEHRVKRLRREQKQALIDGAVQLGTLLD